MSEQEEHLSSGFNLSRWAIEHGAFTGFLLLLCSAIGLASFLDLGQKEDPNFTIMTMAFQVNWPGASSQEMERQVIDPLEEKLRQTPHLDHLHSFTKPGQGIVLINLQEDTDAALVPEIWYQVRKKVSDMRHTLPEGVYGPFFNDEFGDTYIGLFGLSGDAFSFADLKDQAETLRDQVLATPGVSKVDIIGEQEEQILVEIDDNALSQYGLSLPDVQATLAGANGVFPQGAIDTGVVETPIRVEGAFRSISDIEDIRFNLSGRVFRLGDLANVHRGVADPYRFRTRVNGSDSVLVGVVMADGANVTQVGAGVDEALKAFREHAPSGLAITEVSNQREIVHEYVSEFQLKLALSIGIVLLVSFVSLGLRTGIVVAIAVPLVLAMTFLGMNQLGVSFQKVSLGALIISLGLLVDDAMISVEMMQRKLEEGWEKLPAASFAYTSTAFPMLTGTLLTVAGFLPIGLAQSSTGEYVRSLFVVVGLAMTISWFVAVYFTPYIGFHLLKTHARGESHDLYDTPFYRRLRALVNGCMRHRWLSIGFTVALLAGGLALLPRLPKQFFPYSNRPEVMVDLWLPEGSSITQTEAATRRLETFLAGQEGIKTYTSYIGAGAPRFYLPLDQLQDNTNLSQIVVAAESLSDRERLISAIRGFLDNEIPGVRAKVDRLNSGPPIGWPVSLRVSGPDSETLQAIAAKMETIVRADSRTYSVHDNWHESIPTLDLSVDQGRLAGIGLNSQTLKLTLQTEFSGAPIGTFREGDERLPIVVRNPDSQRHRLDRFLDAQIPTATGAWVPLSQAGDWSVGFEPGVIWRRNGIPSIIVQAMIPDDLQPKDVIQELYHQMDDLRAELPPGYSIEMGGAVEKSEEAESSVYKWVPASFLVMFFLLMIQMHNVRRAVMVLLSAPLGIIGAALTLFILDKPFGFVAILGVIALAGMIMRNAVILVEQIQRDVADGGEPWNAVIEATVRRFRPIVLTAAAAILAFLPLTTNVFWGPMAMAMTGGLLVATALTITVLPALYTAWFRLKPDDSSKSAKR